VLQLHTFSTGTTHTVNQEVSCICHFISHICCVLLLTAFSSVAFLNMTICRHRFASCIWVIYSGMSD